MSFSKRALTNTIYSGDLRVIGKAESYTTNSIGYDRILFARPELYDLLFRQIPPGKVHFSNKIVAFDQDSYGVTGTLGDNTAVRVDILVELMVPTTMSVGYVSLLGTTDVLDPLKYPGVLKDDCETSFIIGDKNTPYTWATFTVPGNKICWNVIIQLGLSSIADEDVGSADWTTYGTMGDHFDVTQADRISKVFFEDKLFQTWNHGRVVLIGDGARAMSAMQDAVLLANHIYDILPIIHDNIEAALKEYKKERFDAIKDQYPQSYISAQLVYGLTFYERVIRQIIFNWVPKSIQMKQLTKDTAYRPQSNFLPPAPRRGTVDIIPQRPSKRIQREELAMQ
ncbi:hypothetical protein BGZ95_006035 [Linnemannia exigua]|uniref:FAD-binding domain-containing protein n=1 Tax=Linnemannia exigua TaxID=604196 RepID=A0AAD4HBE2_9FUNG|nr:hypothetical protein BGZ95_006035 [Linnemannia exigua]